MNKATSNFVSAVVMMFAVSAWAQDGSESEAGADPIASEVEEVKIDPNAPPSAEPGCFSARRVRNFSPFSDVNLYVDGGGGNHFLLTMDRNCFGLRNAQGIAIQNQMDRVCSNSQARITFRGIGRSVESCRVRTVEAVEDRDAARALAEIRNQR